MKRKFIFIAIVGTLLLGSVTLLYSTTGDSRKDAADLQAERQEAKRIGLPTTMDEVVVGTIDDSRNAAPLIVEASGLLDTKPDDALTKLAEASRLPSCDFDWSKAQKPKFWKDIKFQQCIQFLLSSATKKFEAGSPGDGRRALQAAHNLINLVSTYPTEEALKQAILGERELYQRLGGLMVEYPGDTVSPVTSRNSAIIFPSVQSETISRRSPKVMLNALRDFVVAGNESATTRSAGPIQAFTTVFNKKAYPLDPWGPASVEATHLAGAIDLMHALDDAPDWIGVRATIDEFADKWKSDERQSAYTLREYAPALQELARLLVDNEAARRVLFTAASIFRYKLEFKQFPTTLTFNGETAYDPFNNEKLHYQQVGLGFELHSIGSDGLDNGGSEREGLSIDKDVSFRFKGDSKD